MAGEEEREKRPSKGFAGLSSMVSDVEATIANAESIGREKSLSRSPTERPDRDGGSQAGETYGEQQSRSHSSAGKSRLDAGRVVGILWILGILGILVSVGVLHQSANNSRPTSHTQTPIAQSSVVPPSARSSRLAQVGPKPKPHISLFEEKPPVGTNLLLTVPQIRYCLAEHIRLDAARVALGPGNNANIQRFNVMVTDFNVRCAHFRYRRGELAEAESDVKAMRPFLQAEGRNRFVGDFSHSAPGDSTKNVNEAPPWMVRETQRLLDRLGYSAGKADGIAGRTTAAAITAFQRDQGLPTNGKVTPGLLTALINKFHATRGGTPSQSVHSQAHHFASTTVLGPTNLTPAEQASMESACATDRLVNGEAYNACLANQLRALERHGSAQELSRPSPP